MAEKNDIKTKHDRFHHNAHIIWP